MQAIAIKPASQRRIMNRDRREVREISAATFETDLRWMGIATEDDVLLGIVFGYATRDKAAAALRRTVGAPRVVTFQSENRLRGQGADFLSELIERLQRYAAGEPINFSDVPVDESHLTPFGRRIVVACRRIGWGSRRSYGELAAECGSAGAARAVGQVMAKNRFPLVVPCHRVLGAGGALGGFSAPEGLRMKRRLLAMEGQTD